MPSKLAILGSTGSIGRQCLSVIDSLDGNFEVVSMAAGSNVDLAATQIAKHHPKLVSVAAAEAAEKMCIRDSFRSARSDGNS